MMITFPDKLFATIKTVFVLVFSAFFVCLHTALLHGDVLIQQIAAMRTIAHRYVLTPVTSWGNGVSWLPSLPPLHSSRGAFEKLGGPVTQSLLINGAMMNADHLL